MKKTLALVMVLVLALAFAACGGNGSETTVPSTAPTTEPTTVPTTEPTTVPTTEPGPVASVGGIDLTGMTLEEAKAALTEAAASYKLSLTVNGKPLSFTAEEIWQNMPHAADEDTASVFLNRMPAYDEALCITEVAEKWNHHFELRDDVMKALEIARADKMIGKSLDAKVTVWTENDEQYDVLNAFADQLALIFITSGATLAKGKAPENAFSETESGLAVLVEPADGEKCGRCWMFVTDAIKDDEGGCLCPRCRKGVLG